MKMRMVAPILIVLLAACCLPACNGGKTPLVDAVIAPIPEAWRRTPAFELATLSDDVQRQALMAAIKELRAKGTDPNWGEDRRGTEEEDFGAIVEKINELVATGKPILAPQLALDGELGALFLLPDEETVKSGTLRGFDARFKFEVLEFDITVMIHRDMAFAFYGIDPNTPEKEFRLRDRRGGVRWVLLYPSKLLLDRKES